MANLTLVCDREPLSGVNAGLIYAPVTFDCTLQRVDILIDENAVGDIVFNLTKNGVAVPGTTLTISNGTRVEQSAALDVDLVFGDELVLNMASGALDPPITLNLVVDDGETGTAIDSTDDLDEGTTNKYFTAGRVWATVLTGIVFTTNAAITAGDSILAALGKLQAQISDRVIKNANITGATKTKLTYDAKGLVTAGADATTDDIAESGAPTNKYFTEARVLATVMAGLAAGANTALANGQSLKTMLQNLQAQISSISGGTTLPSQTGNGGKFLKTDGATLSWDAPLNGYAIFDPDAPYAVPSAYDDEFTGAALDAKWTRDTSWTAPTLAFNSPYSMLQASFASTTYPNAPVYYYQTAPVGDFKFRAKF